MEVDTKTADPTASSSQSQSTPDWLVAVCTRNVVDNDPLFLKMSVAITCSSIAHVEVLVRRKCKHAKCIYRGKHHIGGGDDTGAHDNDVKEHVLQYGIRDMANDNLVTCVVDPKFRKHNGWTFIGLKATKQHAVALERFARSQLGQPYNSVGKWWNFTLGGLLNYPVGTTYEDVRPCTLQLPMQPSSIYLYPPKPPTDRKWFCSEFVAAALLYSGVLVTPRLEPWRTQPKHLHEVLHKLPGSFALLHQHIEINDEEHVEPEEEEEEEDGGADADADSEASGNTNNTNSTDSKHSNANDLV